MPGSNKKSKFGTLSAVTLFLVTFFVVFVTVTWAVITSGLHLTGSAEGSFGSGIFIAVAIIPTLVFAAIVAWLAAAVTGKRFHDDVLPDNKISAMVLWGLGMLVLAWIVAFVVLNMPGNPSQPTLIPAIISVLLQVISLVALGSLGKSSDRTRRKVWGTVLCIAVLIIPFVVLKIAVS